MLNPIIPIWLMTIICILLLFVRRKGKIRYILQIIMILLLFVINLGISIPNGNVIVNDKKIDAKVLFVIDNTISMQALDGNHSTAKTRMSDLQRDCLKIINILDGAKFSVMSFNNEVTINCPYTDNSDHVKNVINSLSPVAHYYAKGSSMNVCKDVLKQDLERNAKAGGKTIVFFISDGEITNKSTLESFNECAENISNGAVLGYGTKEGAEMHVKQSWDGNNEQIIKENGTFPQKNAISKIDENNLKQIAEDLNISYWNMTEGKQLDEEIMLMKDDLEEKVVQTTAREYTNLSFIFVIPLLILLVIQIVDIKRRIV
ncbi:MAG: VWA domain-containing protein [Lachnospiraceae bacterium]|nr:VWA domain-containing protein [Lachnospiraceae bacterium]